MVRPESGCGPVMKTPRPRRPPVPAYEDEMLGTFRLDENTRWYRKVIQWNGAEVRYGFMGESQSMLRRALSTLHALMEDPAGWEARIRGFAAEQLLELKNGVWRGDGEPEFTAQAFAGQLVLNDINTASRGRFTFWFGDGDLFWGHTVRVSGTLKAGPREAAVEG